MKNETGITTAANSKTMNAVENDRLFAAATEANPVIVFGEAEKQQSGTVTPAKKKAARKNKDSK